MDLNGDGVSDLTIMDKKTAAGMVRIVSWLSDGSIQEQTPGRAGSIIVSGRFTSRRRDELALVKFDGVSIALQNLSDNRILGSIPNGGTGAKFILSGCNFTSDARDDLTILNAKSYQLTYAPSEEGDPISAILEVPRGSTILDVSCIDSDGNSRSEVALLTRTGRSGKYKYALSIYSPLGDLIGTRALAVGTPKSIVLVPDSKGSDDIAVIVERSTSLSDLSFFDPISMRALGSPIRVRGLLEASAAFVKDGSDAIPGITVAIKGGAIKRYELRSRRTPISIGNSSGQGLPGGISLSKPALMSYGAATRVR